MAVGNMSLPNVTAAQTPLPIHGAPLVSPSLPFILPVVFSVVYVVGLVGNVTVLLCVGRRGVRSSMCVYVLSLATADTVYLLGGPFFLASFLVQPRWVFGDVGCRLIVGLDTLTMLASIFTLTAMSADRFYAVMYPTQAISEGIQITSKSRWITCAVWIAALLITLPWSVCMSLHESEQAGELVEVCLLSWPSEVGKLVYITLVFVLGFPLPFLVISVLYGTMVYQLWSTMQPVTLEEQDRTARQRRSTLRSFVSVAEVSQRVVETSYIRSNRTVSVKYSVSESVASRQLSKQSVVSRHASTGAGVGGRLQPRRLSRKRQHVSRSVLIIVAVFFVCWLPYGILQVLYYHHVFRPTAAMYYVHLTFVGLSYLNSCANPLLYVMLSERFRREMVQSCSRMCSCIGLRCKKSKRQQQRRHSSEVKDEQQQQLQQQQQGPSTPIEMNNFKRVPTTSMEMNNLRHVHNKIRNDLL
ncbi:PREDICTED: somatostatin receptor type 3-like [Branchiostoma belcheri]|uniref:Somatostatin receptor type 3-like n=1 Tax=Branchiostoma belcheri TaxID=7741 RepID=A0A6P5A9E0_BRABE|nr:PREDICTED: somatostatin receptor type 3-like [Branchiostoma belcheri]